jgi:Uma2 family endonuclease
MSDTPTDTLLTADDLLRLPDDGYQYELVEGRLIRMSPASYKSSLVGGNVHAAMHHYVKQHRLGICAPADGAMRLATDPDTVRAPDISFVRAERVPPGPLPPGFWPVAPDLAVEVLSPSDRFSEVQRKVQDYLDAGTRLVWVLDPEARTATVYHPGGRSSFVDEHGTLDGEDVVPGFRLSLAEVWV